MSPKNVTRAHRQQCQADSALRLDRPPQIDAAQRNKEQQINRGIGEHAPGLRADPVSADRHVMRARHLVKVRDRFPKTHRAAFDRGTASVDVDIDRRLCSRLSRPGKSDGDLLGTYRRKPISPATPTCGRIAFARDDGLRPLEAIEAVGNLQVAIRLGLQIVADDQLSVIQVEHARREEQDERADEQAEIEMQISKPSIEHRGRPATDVCVRGRPASAPLRHPSAQSSSPTPALSCRARQSSGASIRRQTSGALSTAARPAADCAR